MSKKRITIVAIVLFLLIGLTIFTFANKNEDEKLDEGNKTKTEIKKEEEKEDELLTSVEEETITEEPKVEKTYNKPTTAKEVINQIVETVKEVAAGKEEDEYYLKALTAVVSAESTVDDTSYEAAKELVEKVKNTTKKESLSKRLAEVKKALDVKALVDELAEKVENASTKEEINSARSFRTDNAVASKVEELMAGSTKEELTAKLTELAEILDDETAPVLNIEDGKYYNKPVINANDTNEFELILTKEGNEGAAISNDTEVTEEGNYTLRAIDKAFNEVTATFTVDNTAPEFIGTNNKYYNKNVNSVDYEITTNAPTDKDFAIKEENMDEVVINDNSYEVTEAPTTFTEEGTYTLTAKDKAGNVSDPFKFTIDRTAPTATITSTDVSEGTTKKYLVTITTSEPISIINNTIEDCTEKWTQDPSNPTVYTRLYENPTNNSRAVIITDLAGNTSGQLNYHLW